VVASGTPDSKHDGIVLLLYKFGSMSFKAFFALQAAEVVGFTVVCDFEFGCVFV